MSTCTGNCNQGRPCDCCPDVELADVRADIFTLALASIAGSGLVGFVVGLIVGMLNA